MSLFSKILVLSLFLGALAGCGSGDEDACDGVTCFEGTSCVIQDSGPACVPD